MSGGTVNGLVLERASVQLPACGIWTADLWVASGEDLSDQRVTIELGGASFSGAVVSGGVHRERGMYRAVGGAGGWRRPIELPAFRNEAGVKLSQVLQSAARACGETLGTFTDRRIGPAFVADRREAAHALNVLCREAWYVDDAGVTQLGARPSAMFDRPHVVEDQDPRAGRYVIAAEDVQGLAPGATVAGIVAGSVRHELTPDSLRSHVWEASGGWGDRLVGAFARLVEAFTRRTVYLGRYEYRVESSGADYLDLAPARSAVGLPRLANVPMRTGLPGGYGQPAEGSSVDVQFLDGDPTRPVVVGFEGFASDDWRAKGSFLLADEITLGDSESSPTLSTGRFVRYGDPITFGAPGPGTVTAPAPFLCSRVRG